MSSDDYAERRCEILRKIRWHEKLYFRKLPRRKDAVLAEDPEHNPRILEECPHCGGYGRESRYEEVETPEGPETMHLLMSCPECCGLGTTGDVVRYFREDPPSVEAVVATNGWSRCPGCRRSFFTGSQAHWTGKRHTTCGQRIHLVPAEAPDQGPVEDQKPSVHQEP